MLKSVERATAKAGAQTDLQWNTNLDVLICIHVKWICLSSV